MEKQRKIICFHCVESYSSIYRICLPSYAFVDVFCSSLLWVAWLIHSGAVRTDDRAEKEAFPLTLSRWRKTFAPKLENLPTYLPFSVLMTAVVLVQRNKFIFPVSLSISSNSVNLLRAHWLLWSIYIHIKCCIFHGRWIFPTESVYIFHKMKATISFGYILYCVCFNLYCGDFILFCNVCVCVCVCARARVLWCVGFLMCGCFGTLTEVFLNLTRFFLPWLRFFRAFSSV